MVPIGDALAAFPRRQRLTLAVLLAAVVLWHLLLPGFFYRDSAVFIEGPLPALLGAAVGLWLFRTEPSAFQALAGCAGAALASLACVLVFGLLLFGPWDMALGVWAMLRNGLRVPFAALPAAIGSPYGLWVFWMGVKTLLLWGAIGFGILVYRRHGADPRELWGGLRDRRVMSADLRRRGREYSRLYAAAVRAGEAPPAPPPGLMPQMAGGGIEGYARLSYWALRIGLALVGAAGLYAAIGQAVSGQLGAIFLRGLLGG